MNTATKVCARAASAFVLVAALAPVTAQAATSSANLNVSAEVRAACLVSTTPIAFGTVDVASAASKDADGSLRITCTDGTTYTAAAGVGTGSGASYATRYMTSGTDKLSYNIYTTAQRAVVFGDGTNASAPLAGVGNGAQQTVAVYGRVAGSQTSVRAGSYTDTVAITVTY